MKRNALVGVVCLMLSFPLIAQKHVHGEGNLFIAQDGKLWQFQLVLPAADAFGFEHKPETLQQKTTVSTFVDQFSSLLNVVSLDKQCANVHEDIVLPDDFILTSRNSEVDDDHHKHDHDHDHKHDEEHSHNKHSHSDVELSFIVNCPTSPSQLELVVFNQLPSLQKLDVSWNTANANGAMFASKSNIYVSLK